MLTKCTSCFRAIGWKIMGYSIPKWQTHLRNFCSARLHKQPWCDMFLDNYQLICEHSLPREVELQVRNTNIASEIVTIISQHYEEENNLFRFCIELFGSYLKLKYSQTINPSKNTLSRIANEHQDFNKLMINLFVLYFQLQDREIVGQQTFYKSTLPALANHFAFDNIEINTTITQTSKNALKMHIDKLQFQSQKFSSYSIGEYGVKEDIQLNQKTLQKYNVTDGKPDERLYSGAIQIIKQIVRVNSPAEKMRLIQGLPKQIESSVQQFYKKNHIKMNKIDISSQDLTSILLFIIVQANISVFYAHLQIAIMFSPPTSRSASIVQALLKACETLQNGSINYREYPQLFSEVSQKNMRKGSEGPSFFDEVTSLDF